MHISLIGCGHISFKHIEAAVNNKVSIRLFACCQPIIERDETREPEYKKAMPDARIAIYTDYHEMLENGKTSFFGVASSSIYHTHIANECINVC